MGVNHGGGDVFVAEEFLDGANIIALFQQVRSETVPERVAVCGLGDSAGPDGVFDGVLEVFLVDMVAAFLAAPRIEG